MLEHLRRILESLTKESTAVILGDEFCGEGFGDWLSGLSDVRIGSARIEWIKVVRRWLEDRVDYQCIAVPCPDPGMRKVLGSRTVFVYGTNRDSRNVPKHCVDELLKCVTSSDTVLALCLTKPLNIVSQALVLASSMGKRVVLISNRVPDELRVLEAELVELGCEEFIEFLRKSCS